ncbi:hypothetical protein [Simplicispira suum]|nr:hypothetical protein [Simplicispira suum]
MKSLFPTLIAWACAAGFSAPAVAAGEPNPVVQMIRQTASSNSRLGVCVALQRANAAPTKGDDEKRRIEAIQLVAQKINNRDPHMLRARADAARLGLYGFKTDQNLALSLYKKAKIPDAGLNAALMLYRGTDYSNNAKAAKEILNVLYSSGAATDRTRGPVGGQAHYIAGLIHEGGYAGQVDMKKAFIHFRSSARNSYVPGIYHYLRLIVRNLPELTRAEQQVATQEIRLMTNRWRWQAAEIMMINGDMHAGGWFPDDKDGYFAQYYWRVAQRMGDGSVIPNIQSLLQQRIRRMSNENEDRLQNDVQVALRNVANTKHDLEFSDLCAE